MKDAQDSVAQKKRYIADLFGEVGVSTKALDGIEWGKPKGHRNISNVLNSIFGKLETIRKMDDQTVLTLSEELGRIAYQYHAKTFPEKLKNLPKLEELKSFYLTSATGGPVASAYARGVNIANEMNKLALFFDRIVLPDFAYRTLILRQTMRPDWLRKRIFLDFASLLTILPWLDVIEFIPHPVNWTGVDFLILNLSNQDASDMRWKKACSLDDDRGLQGATLLKNAEEYVSDQTKGELLDGWGGAKKFAFESLTQGASAEAASAVIGSAFTDCAPIVDTRRSWRLLGLWIESGQIYLIEVD